MSWIVALGILTTTIMLGMIAFIIFWIGKHSIGFCRKVWSGKERDLDQNMSASLVGCMCLFLICWAVIKYVGSACVWMVS